MEDDRIRDLLRRADAGGDAPDSRGDIAGAVRSTIRRRQIIAVAAGVCAVCFAIALTAWRLLPEPSRTNPLAMGNGPDAGSTHPATGTSSLPLDLATIEFEARSHEQAAQRLWAAERTNKLLALAEAAPDPLEIIGRQRDRAALTAVDRADTCARQGRFAQAAQGYDQAIKLFPETHWAAVARQRLSRLENRKDG